jgi:hypothetical protein
MDLETSVANTESVCLGLATSVTLFCARCEQPFTPTNARQRFCTGACRQAAHRESPAHQALLARKRQATLNFKIARRRAISLTFDGRSSGSLSNAGRDRVRRSA